MRSLMPLASILALGGCGAPSLPVSPELDASSEAGVSSAREADPAIDAAAGEPWPIAHHDVHQAVHQARPDAGAEARSAVVPANGGKDDRCFDQRAAAASRTCLSTGCGYETGAADDAGCRIICAADYDQSCTTDSDCVEVGEGSTCTGLCGIACGLHGINRSALARYQADLRAGGFNPAGVECACPNDTGVCCRGGRCVESICCLNPCQPDGAPVE